MAIKVGGITVIDDSRNLTNISGGSISGIQSGGQTIGAGATVLNFTGSGNELTYNAGTNTIDITIAGSGGGGGSVSPTGILTSAFYSNSNTISDDADLNQPNTNYFVVGPVSITGSTVITVGAGSTFKVL